MKISDEVNKLNRHAQIVLIAFFMGVIFFGMIGSFFKSDMFIDFREERKLAELPQFDENTTFKSIPGSITDFVADNFGARKLLLSGYFRLRLDVLDSDLGLPGIIGKNGWLFIDGEVPTFRNQMVLSEHHAEEIRSRLDMWCEYARSRNAKLVLFVGPNKSTIYPDKMPDYLSRFASNPSLIDQVYNLDYNCPFIKVDLREVLSENRDELLYYKWGTHWNLRAAQLAWEQIIDDINQSVSGLNWPVVEKTIDYRPARPLEDSMWQWFGKDDPHEVMLPVIQFSNAGREKGDSISATKILAYGDSFLQFMFDSSNVIANDYETWVLQAGEKFQNHEDKINKDAWLITDFGNQRDVKVMDTYKPDIVMLEVVERNILTLAQLPVLGNWQQDSQLFTAEKLKVDMQPSDFVGSWKAGDGVGSIARGEQLNLVVSTETGLKGVGVIIGDLIKIDSWNVTGRLSKDKNKIYWSNSFVWAKQMN